MKYVREGRDGYKMKASDLPSFLYPHGTMYDEENLDRGLFRGHVLIRVCFLFLLEFQDLYLLILCYSGIAFDLHRRLFGFDGPSCCVKAI
jgi:hypothetical protein